MTFTCRQCGTCCMYLGDYIVIEEKLSAFEFRCESVSTGTPFSATVDKDKQEIFLDYTFPDTYPHACRFLRPDGNLIRCTIHRDSPAQCKFYRCVVLRIFDTGGNLIGHVTGTLALHSDNPGLRELWERVVRERPRSDDEAEPWIEAFLKNAGYRIQ